MPGTSEPGAYVVQVDVYIARRKRIHSVIDPSGIPVFHAPLITDVLDWLSENEISRVRFTDEETTYWVSFARMPTVHPSTGD